MDLIYFFLNMKKKERIKKSTREQWNDKKNIDNYFN